MTTRPALILMVFAQTCGAALSQAQSPNMIGTWKVEIAFTNGDSRSLRFDAQGAGKGSFLLLDPKLNVWGPARPSEAKWTQGDGNSVTFSGGAPNPASNECGRPGRDLITTKSSHRSRLESNGFKESPRATCSSATEI